MASNHGNLYKHHYLPWFKGSYGVHAEVNGKEEVKGENGDRNGDGNRDGNRNGESRPAGAEQGRERRKGRRARAGRAEGAEAKNGDPSVGNVQPYVTAYEWEGDN